jgi:molybdopterin molybdotransferase
MLAAALGTAGAIVERIPAVDDTVQAHRAALMRALDHDVVISSGGVSVGTHDLVRAVARELGVEERFWRIALRPGKPLSFGVRGATLMFGLPGNPVSTLVCFELFVRSALYGLQGAREIAPAFATGILVDAVRRNSLRDEMIRVRRMVDGQLKPLSGQESHQITTMAQADGLARIPSGSGELAAGSEVSYLPLH